MGSSKRSSGFSVVEIILVVAVIALLGYLGWRFYSLQQANGNDKPSLGATTTQGSTTSEGVPTAPEIKSAQDLDKAEAALDTTDTSSDSSQLDAETTRF